MDFKTMLYRAWVAPEAPFVTVLLAVLVTALVGSLLELAGATSIAAAAAALPAGVAAATVIAAGLLARSEP